jgi:hypothetical protein
LTPFIDPIDGCTIVAIPSRSTCDTDRSWAVARVLAVAVRRTLVVRLGLYLRTARDHLRHGDLRSLVRSSAALLYSDSASVVIRKDLRTEAAPRRSSAQIRPASASDVLALVAGQPDDDADADELWERRLRRHVMSTIGADRCRVADGAKGQPAFMQYLFTAQDNDDLQSHFSGLFPLLAQDEAMVEFLYVTPDERTPGFVVSCLVQVAEEARQRGAMSVISFIDPGNKGALFVNHLAGFQAHAVRRQKRRLLRRSYSFEDWPAGTSRALVDLARTGAL